MYSIVFLFNQLRYVYIIYIFIKTYMYCIMYTYCSLISIVYYGIMANYGLVYTN